MKKDAATYAALIFTVLFWGLSFIGTKIALTSFSPFVCMFLRFGLAACFFIFIFMRYGFPKINPRDHKKLILTAVFEPGLYFAFETIGLTYTSASEASIILALVPVTVMIFAHFFLRETISRTGVFGIILSLIGIYILVTGDSGLRLTFNGSFLGDLLILGSVLSASLYMVLARDLGKTLSSLEITGLQVIYGAVLFAPAFFIKLPGISWQEVSQQSIGAIVFLAVFCTIAAFFMYNYALTRIEASRASVFINGIPVITAIGAWIILGERLTQLQIVGGIVVLLAVFTANWHTEQHNAVPTEQKDFIS